MGKIKRAASRILALFPFEVPLYEQAGLPVTYVGHPLADVLPMEPDQGRAQHELKVTRGQLVIALLPGSRQSELDYMADLFVKTAARIHEQMPNTCFLVPVVSKETRWKFQAAISRLEAESLPISILFGHSHLAMEAADAVVVASGTATLEAALLKRPMVITYRMSPLSWQILRHMNYLPYVGLPNILAGKLVVPELLQNQATPENITDTVIQLLTDKDKAAEIRREFEAIHHVLRQNTEEKAAQAILSMLN
jgi:lipid-A-disaccharide synthase